MYGNLLRRDPDLQGANAYFNALFAGISDILLEASVMGSAEYMTHV